MELPTTYDDDLLGYEGRFYPDGTPAQSRVYSMVFPPIGFFPFYGIGNGDYHGFYWPIGREDQPPIVAFSSHDAWSLIPEHSNIEALYSCTLAHASRSATVEGESTAGFPPTLCLAGVLRLRIESAVG